MQKIIYWVFLALFVGVACAEPSGEGIFFDGRTYYEVPQSEITVDPTGFSVACWVKSDIATSQVYVNMGNAGTGFTLYLYDVDPAVRMLVEYNPSGTPTYSSAKAPPTPTNIWTHYTGTYDGSAWININTGIISDNNYDTGSLYLDSDTCWRITGPTRSGPQEYNPGGEISMWATRDVGESWSRIKKMTWNSQYNHTYLRRPVNVHPDFYGLWADGHGRQPSESRLYFCNDRGDVFMLPQTVTEDFVAPQRVYKIPGTVIKLISAE